MYKNVTKNMNLNAVGKIHDFLGNNRNNLDKKNKKFLLIENHPFHRNYCWNEWTYF